MASMAALLSLFEPVRVASEYVPPAAVPLTVEVVETPPRQPYRRVSGLLLNGKISAILETEGQSDVVWVGSVILRSGSKVQVISIEPDQLVLKTLDTRKPFWVRVGFDGPIGIGS